MSEVTKITVPEMVDTLTGFDEIAIEKVFKADWHTLHSTKPITFARALVFVDVRREPRSLDDSAALEFVKALPWGEVNAWFLDPPEDDDLDPDAAASTESGKGDDTHESRPPN